jgi:hypothetical protein
MAETPSKRRRKGREAFEPGVDPMQVQPYAPGSFSYDHRLKDWLDGWNEAKEQYEQEIEKDSEPTLEERLNSLEERVDRLERWRYDR